VSRGRLRRHHPLCPYRATSADDTLRYRVRRKPPLQAHLHRVIGAPADRLIEIPDVGVLWIGPQGLRSGTCEARIGSEYSSRLSRCGIDVGVQRPPARKFNGHATFCWSRAPRRPPNFWTAEWCARASPHRRRATCVTYYYELAKIEPLAGLSLVTFVVLVPRNLVSGSSDSECVHRSSHHRPERHFRDGAI
jgi:hypothetical protein